MPACCNGHDPDLYPNKTYLASCHMRDVIVIATTDRRARQFVREALHLNEADHINLHCLSDDEEYQCRQQGIEALEQRSH